MIWNRDRTPAAPDWPGIWSVTWHFRGTESPGNRHTTVVQGTPDDLPGLAETVCRTETGSTRHASHIIIDGCAPAG